MNLCLAVGLGPVGAGADVADAERPAGKGMGRGTVGATVVGEQALDPHPVAPEEVDGAAQEADRGARLLVLQDLDVGQACGVVDADVDELPADPPGGPDPPRR